MSGGSPGKPELRSVFIAQIAAYTALVAAIVAPLASCTGLQGREHREVNEYGDVIVMLQCDVAPSIQYAKKYTKEHRQELLIYKGKYATSVTEFYPHLPSNRLMREPLFARQFSAECLKSWADRGDQLSQLMSVRRLSSASSDWVNSKEWVEYLELAAAPDLDVECPDRGATQISQCNQELIQGMPNCSCGSPEAQWALASYVCEISGDGDRASALYRQAAIAGVAVNTFIPPNCRQGLKRPDYLKGFD